MEAIGKDWNGRCLRVVGEFRVHLLSKQNPHLLWVKGQAELADKSHPWVPEDGNECPPRVLNCHKGDWHIDFELHPQFEIYPRQLYAFHRYLCGIAETLAKENPDVFSSVHVVLKVSTEPTSFRTPAGEEIYKAAEVAVKKALADISGE